MELTYDNELELNSTTDVDPIIGVTLLIVVNNLN